MSWRLLPRIEKFLLLAFAAQALFVVYLCAFGAWQVTRPAWLELTTGHVILVAMSAAIFALAIVAVVAILKRRRVGLMCCAVFYLVQLVAVKFTNGAVWSFNFFPTITFRLNGDREFPVELNVFALIMLVTSLVAWRLRDADGARG